jgi:hypothetical protein
MRRTLEDELAGWQPLPIPGVGTENFDASANRLASAGLFVVHSIEIHAM